MWRHVLVEVGRMFTPGCCKSRANNHRRIDRYHPGIGISFSTMPGVTPKKQPNATEAAPNEKVEALQWCSTTMLVIELGSQSTHAVSALQERQMVVHE